MYSHLIIMSAPNYLYLFYLIVSEWQGGSWGSLCNVNQSSGQQQKTLKYEKIIDLLMEFL